MRYFLKLCSITLFFLLGINNETFCASLALDMPLDSLSVSNNIPVNKPTVSVHDMFKDVAQDELLKMMEEGQQFIKYLEEHGTPEEKMQFAQAMEETLKGFSEDDWQEFEKIVETVQDKLPPLVIEPKEDNTLPAPVVEQPKKQEVKSVVVDNSLEKIINDIHKAISSILIKVKSDKILTERMTIGWNNKDKFNEMARLLQCLNKKEHIQKLISSKDEEIQSLLDSIKNFNKRLKAENDQFVIADTFGLEIKEETSLNNLKKLNNIIDFLDTAIESLLPKIIKFIEAYEPEALKKSQQADDIAKKSLENATKIEKQKRPIGYINSTDKSPSHGSQKNNPANGNQYFNPGAKYNQQPNYNNTDQTRLNPLAVTQEATKNLPQDNSVNSEEKTKENNKYIQNSSYLKAIDSLENYIDSYGNKDIAQYMTTINKSTDIYKPFGSPIEEQEKIRAEEIRQKRTDSSLLPTEEIFLQKHDEQIQLAHENFASNTQAAHTHYADLRESFESISDQVNEMTSVLSIIKKDLDQMNSKELEQLNRSHALKKFSQRIHQYHNEFKKIQSELRNKHKIHKLQKKDPYEINAYNELATKAESLHGLDAKIHEAKSLLENLHKSIKSLISRRRRDENKALSRR
jgi:hypothetical protein